MTKLNTLFASAVVFAISTLNLSADPIPAKIVPAATSSSNTKKVARTLVIVATEKDADFSKYDDTDFTWTSPTDITVPEPNVTTATADCKKRSCTIQVNIVKEFVGKAGLNIAAEGLSGILVIKSQDVAQAEAAAYGAATQAKTATQNANTAKTTAENTAKELEALKAKYNLFHQTMVGEDSRVIGGTIGDIFSKLAQLENGSGGKSLTPDEIKQLIKEGFDKMPKGLTEAQVNAMIMKLLTSDDTLKQAIIACGGCEPEKIPGLLGNMFATVRMFNAHVDPKGAKKEGNTLTAAVNEKGKHVSTEHAVKDASADQFEKLLAIKRAAYVERLNANAKAAEKPVEKKEGK